MNIKNKSGIAFFLLLSLPVFAESRIPLTMGLPSLILSYTVVFGCILLSIVFLIVGGLNLKKYREKPQKVHLLKPLVLLTAGAILFGLGSTSNLIQDILFGHDDDKIYDL